MLLTQLIESARRYLTDHGYTKSTVYHNYVWHWNSFSKTIATDAVYETSLLTDYLPQMYGKNLLLLTPEAMSHSEYIRFVAFRALDSFYKTGSIPGTSMSWARIRQPLTAESNYVLTLFREHLEELDYKGKPKKYSCSIVHSFLLDCPFETMDAESLLGYLLSLAAKSKTTVKSEQKVPRRFPSFLWKQGLTSWDFSHLILSTKNTVNKEIPSVYSTEEIALLLNYLHDNGVSKLRNYTIAVLIAVYGYRASDIAALKLSDIDWDNGKVCIIQEKASVRLTHDLTSFCGNALADYLLKERPVSSSSFVFIKADGSPITPTGVSSMIFNGFIHCGININGRKHGSHSLRHSLASNMLEQGTNLLDISHVLGHSGVKSTMVYTKVDVRHLRMCGLEVPGYGK